MEGNVGIKLDVNFINPFISGALETLKVQCSIEAAAEKPYVKTEKTPLSVDIAGVIGLTSKTFTGSVSICFPMQTFLIIMSGMLGETYNEFSSDLEDGAGELLNIIFGYAKRELNAKGYSIEKAIPTVIKGNDIKINTVSKAPSIIVPFNSNAGKFFIEIGLDS